MGGQGTEPSPTLLPSAPLCLTESIFGSSPSTHKLHGRRPQSFKRGSVATSFPVQEEADAEEKEAFFAFMEQLEASHSLPE